MNGDFIGRNVGTGNDFFSLSTRISRSFALSERWRLEAMAEVFQRAESSQQSHENGTFGSGAYPAAPSSTFGQVTAVNDPRSVQLALRLRF